MPPINFFAPSTLISALNSSKTHLAPLLKRYNLSKPLIVTDSGILQANLLSSPLNALRESSISPTVFKDVTANPTEDNVLNGVNSCLESGADCIIGIGGGSPLDTAKLIAYFGLDVNRETKLGDCYGVDNLPYNSKSKLLSASSNRMPLILIPTTAGTGSEATPISIITNPSAGTKLGIVSPIIIPDVAMLDASLTVGLPQRVSAGTGIDAMIHAIESITSLHKSNPLSDLYAYKALSLLSSNISTVADPNDGGIGAANLESRESMLLGSYYAGLAFANSPVGGVHALAYPLGGYTTIDGRKFNIPHGESCGLMLSSVIRFNILGRAAKDGENSGVVNGDTKCINQYAKMLDVIFPDDAANFAVSTNGNNPNSDLTKALKLSSKLTELMLSLKLSPDLSAVGVLQGDIQGLSEDSVAKQQRLLGNNPRVIGVEEAKGIYESCL